MRVVVHDYSGHPGQVQLSRALASRGHVVEHQYCDGYTSGHGRLETGPDDPETLTVRSVPMRGSFARYSALKRVQQEVQYAAAAETAIVDASPEAVVLSNVPLLAHALLARRLHRRGIPMVFWHQDVYSAAVASAARARSRALGAAAGATAARLEAGVARRSSAVVAITDRFLPVHTSWRTAHKVRVIENWGPLNEVLPRPRSNAWSRAHGLEDRPVVMYSGTLGLKHDPRLLLDLARHLPEVVPRAVVVVVSEGRGRAWLADQAQDEGLEALKLVDFQPYEQLPDVLASADVLVALLEPDASRYSVPSKILTYLCAGRAVVASMPRDNAAAAAITSSGAGAVVAPGDTRGFTSAVARVLLDDADRERQGLQARRYAEARFDLDDAAQGFEDVLREVTA